MPDPLASVTDLEARRSDRGDPVPSGTVPGADYRGLVCGTCGSAWWTAAVTLELSGLIGAFTAVECRVCGTPIGKDDTP